MLEVSKLIKNYQNLDSNLKGSFEEIFFESLEESSIRDIVEQDLKYIEDWKEENEDAIELYEELKQTMLNLDMNKIDLESKIIKELHAFTLEIYEEGMIYECPSLEDIYKDIIIALEKGYVLEIEELKKSIYEVERK